MLHLPNIEIADLCKMNLTSVSKNRAVIVTKVTEAWKARSRAYRADDGRTGEEAGTQQGHGQLGIMSLKMDRKMPTCAPV